ncbi:caspase family protein [Variovorax guangxiensis]|uniref:caspase family protein n=1 Tax=Variovorax guangxiensis TaxID=1775474 RepID=UPI0028652BA3|nr:caspase family protein [Variovorax guangxiensis]MDR6859880.1 hypothetical protein [Variovorax guangxiensis]
MAQGRRVCLAIGISDAGGGLDYLGGALNGARGVHHWATSLGYDSRLLVDDGPRIHVDTVRQALLELLPRGSATERLILYFAGHGFIAQGDNGLWLLNDWKEHGRAVAVELLRRKLREYGVAQIAIIADACRQLPPDTEVADLTQDGVLGSGFTAPLANPLIDRFMATQDGRAAYMIPGPTPEEDRCVFSGVLLEGLWGHAQALSKREKRKVISLSLADFLRTRVPEVAGQYRLDMTPQAFPGFPELADVYFDLDQEPPPPAPVFAPWPPPPQNAAIDRATAQGSIAHHSDPALRDVVGRIAIPATITYGNGMLKTIALGTVEKLGTLLGKLMRRGRKAGPSRPDPMPKRPNHLSEEAWEALKAKVTLESSIELDPEERRDLEWLAERGRTMEMQKAAQAQRQRDHDETLRLIRSVRVPSDLRQGLVVAGEVRQIWAAPELTFSRLGSEAAWALDGPHVDGRQFLVEFENRSFGACVAMDYMVARLGHNGSGIAAMVFQPGYSDPHDLTALALTEEAIARLASGTLDIAETTDLATDLRMLKHVNPVLGVICAYLYDAIGDQDSIRRMAYFYVQNYQAIPYDIAFLADLASQEHPDGRLRAIVPPLPEREPRTEHEGEFQWTTTSTPAAEGSIGGRVFWMRQGWPFLASATPSETAMGSGIADLIQGLLPTPFTTLDDAAGRKLITYLKLEPRL